MYINDLPNVSTEISTLLFADDTTVCMSNRNFNSLIHGFNNELKKLRQWLIDNKLSINIEKTHYLLFSNRCPDGEEDSLYFNNIKLNMQRNGKFLGVNMDDKLTFKDHVSYICSKISKTVGIFYKIHSYVPEQILINLYYSLVYPYLIYCNLAWGGCALQHLDRLLLIQKKIVRLITKETYLAHTNPLFYRTSILKVDDLFFYL